MSSGDSKTEGVARVYADAILELAESQGQADVLLDEFDEFLKLIETDPAFSGFITNPDIDARARTDVFEKAFRGRASELFVDALQVINRKGRLDIIAEVIEQYRLGLEVLREKVDVRVTSAIPLTEELRSALKAAASAYAGRDALLIEDVDPELLGGLVVAIDDSKLDTSLSRHLARMRSRLMDRGMRAILGEGEMDFVEGSPV